MFVGIILIVSSLMDSWATLSEDISDGRLRVSHATLLLGITHFLRTLPDVVEGLERTTKRSEESK